jgi:hypothetical protein
LSIDEVEAILIAKTLYRCDGDITQVAEACVLSSVALYRRIDKHSLIIGLEDNRPNSKLLRKLKQLVRREMGIVASAQI